MSIPENSNNPADDQICFIEQVLTERQRYLLENADKRIAAFMKESIQLRNPTRDTLLSDIPRDSVVQDYESLTEKDRYFRHLVVDDPVHLTSLLRQYSTTPGLLFRGVSQARYRLRASMQRALLSLETLPAMTYRAVWTKLVHGLRTAQNGLLTRYMHQQGIHDITDLGALGFLQHHGCPTPLLDWTYDLQQALFFASGSEQDPTSSGINAYLSLYAIRASTAEAFSLKPIVQSIFSLVADASSVLDREPGMMDSLFDEITRSTGRDVRKGVEEALRKRRVSRYFRDRLYKILDIDFLSASEVIFVSDKDDMPDLALRLYNNLNLVNQDGAFFMNTYPFSSLEEVLEDVKFQSADGAKEHVITCLDINRELLPLISRELEVAHITHDTVFPDPYKISQEIGSKALRL